MTCADRIEAIFRGDFVDHVPFVMKGWRVPQCEAERALRNDGLGVLDSRPVYTRRTPNVKTETLSYTEESVSLRRTTIRTPAGTLNRVDRQVAVEKTEGTSWRVELPFKTPDDYAAVEFSIRDARYEAGYAPFLKAREQIGSDAFFKTSAPGAPIHTLMYDIMGLEAFSVEWAERRDSVLRLLDAMSANQRQIYDIVAGSPAWVVQCGGNYAPEVLGRERLIDHVVPHWCEAADILHAGGKLLGSHLDANSRPWADVIAKSPLDWIEAFAPAPDNDTTVAEARELWPGKTLFVNFPSSVHLADAETIARTTREILVDAAPGDRFILGITENVPENRWRESFRTILDTVKISGRLPISSRQGDDRG